MKATVITVDPDAAQFGDPSDIREMLLELRQAGMDVFLTDEENERSAVIDHKLVWHGGMNLLGREDVWDNLIRIESTSAAAELLEMTDRVKNSASNEIL